MPGAKRKKDKLLPKGGKRRSDVKKRKGRSVNSDRGKKSSLAHKGRDRALTLGAPMAVFFGEKDKFPQRRKGGGRERTPVPMWGGGPSKPSGGGAK